MDTTSSDDEPTVSGQPPPVLVFGSTDPCPSSVTGEPEILEVTKIFENASIPSCIYGIPALSYYHAAQLQFDWEICLPSAMADKAASLLKSEYSHVYEIFPGTTTRLFSIIHIYPRFKVKGFDLSFIILPSDDYHFECTPSNIERSYKGLPYPKLAPFTQAVLDSNNMHYLTDLVDGMNLTEEWGQQNLELSGTRDIAWIRRKNAKVRRLIPDPDESCWYELPEGEEGLTRKDTYENIVRTKERRIGVECPKEVYATRFCGHGDGDPRLNIRHLF
ncbi:hypothetical protein FQN49_007928 [Arthroderma sp. PD_2]|nr:hypothetical protein FQN49_007928 [Arthroderma sp. PD_2]